jgi:hypothetical protein
MIPNEQKIPCPVCQTAISFTVAALIAGAQFACPNCQASVGLAAESKPLVDEAIKKFPK